MGIAVLGVAAAAAIVFWCYAPCVRGPFLFDDWRLPFVNAGASAVSLRMQDYSGGITEWMRGVRPLLMATYWVNAQFPESDTYWYHIVNVLIHCLTGLFVFLIVRRLSGLAYPNADRALRTSISAFAALLFLLHPVQAEAVAYLAGRSESLSAMLALAGFTVYIYRDAARCSWARAAATLALLGAAVLSKEHTLVFPLLLALTDWWWFSPAPVKGLRANFRLYAFLGLGMLAGVCWFWPLLTRASSAGFGLANLKWYEYFFTQCRALFVYLAMFVAPVRLSPDWDFSISRNLLAHGAYLGLLALSALAVLAWRWRRRFPLASYGFFVFLLLMAPTSSIMPIADPITERRLYCSMAGLLLVVAEFCYRVRAPRRAMAAAGCAVLAAAAFAMHSRARVWSDDVLFWKEVVRTSPAKARGQWELATAYYEQKRCSEALGQFESARQAGHAPAVTVLVNWAHACECENQQDAALEKLQEAARLAPSAYVYSQLGLHYARRNRLTESLEALATAEALDPKFAMLYLYRANVELALSRVPDAMRDYRKALSLNPKLVSARRTLDQLEGLMGRATSSR
jgi:protein O-mannosyl-transferase